MDKQNQNTTLNKYGYIKDRRTRDNFVLGGFTKVPKVVLQPDGQWDNGLVDIEIQRNKFFDSYNCTGFTISTIAEMTMKKKYGLKVNYSDRALGINAGTYPPGNTVSKVSDTARRKGLIKETLLPFKDIRNVDEYYSPSPLPEDLKQKGLLWKDRYTLMHEWVDEKDLKEALTYSPIGIAVYAWFENSDGIYSKPKGQEDTHFTVLYGYDDKRQVWKIFDSYDNTKKLYTYSSGISTAKRYYIEEKSVEEQNRNILQKFINLLQNFYVYLIKKPVQVGWQLVQETFKKRT